MEWRLNHVGQMAQSVQDYSVSSILYFHVSFEILITYTTITIEKIEQISAIEKEIFPHFSILKNFISFTPI